MNDLFSIGIKRTPFHYELRKLREKQNLTQDQVSKKVGIHIQYYGQIETLKRKPKGDEALAIADFFGVPVGELFPQWSELVYDPKRKKLSPVVFTIEKKQLESKENPSLVSLPNASTGKCE